MKRRHRLACPLLLSLMLVAALPTHAETCPAGTLVGQAETDAADGDAGDTGTTPASLRAPASRAPATAARDAANPAPRARWHRYLPGMFK